MLVLMFICVPVNKHLFWDLITIKGHPVFVQQKSTATT